MQRVQRGFTLIEVLVVVSILGVLAGLISILVVQAQRKREEMEAKLVVQTQLPTAINRFKAEINNRLPPMTMAELAGYPGWAGLAVTGNTTNECVECLYVALRHKDLTTQLTELAGAKPFGNTDGDIWNKIPDGSDVPEAREILDTWGNPIVYISKNGYDQPVRIVNAKGTEVEVHAVKKPSGVHYNQDSFQVISLGANGVQDDSGGDDIGNFTREEE